MITVTIFQNASGMYKAVRSSGHAGYAEYGQDIVCAAVSILFINTLNSIETFTKDKDSMNIVQNEDDGYLLCEFHSELSKESVLLLDAMVLGLSEVEKQYSNKYVRLVFEEV